VGSSLAWRSRRRVGRRLRPSAIARVGCADGHGRRIVQLLDSYAADKCEEVREIAETPAINQVVVPAGCTDALQPWNPYVFGAFKAIYHRLYRCEVVGPGSKAQIASMLVRARIGLPASAILKAWEHFRGGWS
jgi:hypothetical protein